MMLKKNILNTNHLRSFFSDSGFIGGLLGIFIFLLVFGIYILNPAHALWLLISNDDPAQHYLGWEFFRHDAWHFPLGVFKNYGFPIKTSVVYTDSIPLLAIFFKLFSPLLPKNFQYFGIWIMLCCFLQGVFGWLLCSKWTRHPLFKLIGTLFFILSPIMQLRFNGHQALGGQWVLLAAIYLYSLSGEKKIFISWLCLTAVTSLIHAYLLMMVLAIFCAFLLKEKFIEKKSLKTLTILFISTVVTLLFTLFLSGYFILGSDVKSAGFNIYSLNLLSPFLSTFDQWSILPTLNVLPTAPGQAFEGFNYLGAGILFLIPFAVYNLYRSHQFKNWLKKDWPLFLVCLLLIVYALSNRVGLSTYELFSYPLPTFFLNIAETFRASGRFFWPVYYVIITVVLSILFKQNHKWIIIILLSAIFLQVIDFYEKFKSTHFRYTEAILSPQYQNHFPSPFWHQAAKHYRHLVVMNLEDDEFPSLAHFAATHGLTINIGSFARKDQAAIKREDNKTRARFEEGRFEKNTLYIGSKQDSVMITAQNRLSQFDVTGVVDNVWVVAPRWKQYDKNNSNILPASKGPYHYKTFPLNQTVQFTEDEQSESYLIDGWSNPSPLGLWSDGSSASLGLYIPNKILKATFTVSAYLQKSHKNLIVEVWVDHHKNAVWNFNKPGKQNREIILTPSASKQDTKNELIRFVFIHPASPKQLGASGDPRMLGLFLSSLTITALDH